MFSSLSLSDKAIMDISILLILIIFCIREFVVSLLIIFKGKKYKLSAVLLFWPIVLIIKAFSRKEYERILRNYYKRIRFFAFSSVFGAVLSIWIFIRALMDSIGM